MYFCQQTSPRISIWSSSDGVKRRIQAACKQSIANLRCAGFSCSRADDLEPFNGHHNISMLLSPRNSDQVDLGSSFAPTHGCCAALKAVHGVMGVWRTEHLLASCTRKGIPGLFFGTHPARQSIDCSALALYNAPLGRDFRREALQLALYNQDIDV